jgi:hypothetical protein
LVFACLPACPTCLQNVSEFEDKEFANVSKEDLKLADQDTKQEKKKDKAFKVGGVVDGRCWWWWWAPGVVEGWPKGG